MLTYMQVINVLQSQALRVIQRFRYTILSRYTNALITDVYSTKLEKYLFVYASGADMLCDGISQQDIKDLFVSAVSLMTF